MERKKPLLLLFVLLFLVLALFPYSWAFADTGKSVFVIGNPKYTSDGNIYTMDVAPYIKKGRVFVPIRYLAIACGVNPTDITYNNGYITIIKGSTTIRLAVGLPFLAVNSKTNIMDVSPEMVNGRSFLPARWVAEALGYQVSWDELTQSVTITRKTYSTSELVSIVQPTVVYIETQRVSGSGFFTSSDGEILTNSHVVAGASFINVTTYDGRTYKATVEKAIPYIDLAILRIQGDGFPFLSLGNTQPQAGDQILVFGHPLGVKNTVSQGVISNPSKDISEIYPNKKSFTIMQMSVPIYPGNSGGPVVNMSGEVIGVAFAFRSDANTISLAIPINYYKAVQQRTSFDTRTDFEMFGETYWQEWFPQEQIISSAIETAMQYQREGRIYSQLTTLENAINTVETLETDVASYIAQYPEINNLHDTYLKALECYRQVLIRYQEVARLLDPANTPNLYVVDKAQNLLNEAKYYTDQYNFWYNKFVEQWGNLNNQLYH